jgi:hypothetical protein
MRTRGSTLSHGLVAAAAAIVAAAATYGAMTFVAPSRAQTPPAPTQRVEVMTQALADLPGREVRITLLDLMPGHASPATTCSATSSTAPTNGRSTTGR